MSSSCHKLHELFNNIERIHFPYDEKSIFKNGVYILFENGEYAHGMDRIVRVGTHTGADQLQSRIKQHFLNKNKDRSIFRKNIGRAILYKDNDPFLKQWNWDLTTKKAKERYLPSLNVNKQQYIETLVSDYIQKNFSFVVFNVKSKEERLGWEEKIISTISLCNECRPSQNWLGLHSPKNKIQESGLWQVNGLYKESLTRSEITVLENLVKATS